MNRTCYKCKVTKSILEYYKDKTMSLGHSRLCKDCTKVKSKLRKRDLPQIQEYRTTKRGHLSALLGLAVQRAKHRKLEYNLTLDYICSIAEPTCPILGIELEYGYGQLIGKKTVTANSPSLDRLDTSKGYTIGNVQVVSYKANTMKSNATNIELTRFAEWVTNNVK